MITFTKEQLIASAHARIEFAEMMLAGELEPLKERTWSIELELARIALASLEAEPVAYIFKHPAGRLFWSLTDESNKGQSDVMPVYTAPPVPANAEPVAWLWSHRKHPSEVTLVRPEDDERAEGAHWSGWSCQALYGVQPAPASVADDIDTRMKNAGMLSAAEIIAGQPIDAFMKHAGVVDLESLLKWSEMRRAEFLRMQAKYELGDNQKDDMYEWVISHVAAFNELHVNIRAAMLQGAEHDFREIVNSSTNNCRENAETSTKCWCRTCRPVTISDMRFVVCPECGNKRCPHAIDHRNACTGSNEPGQVGSAYPAAPQQEVKNV
uniref:hypothetical protein n=1 Tax=Enterobacter roggenkampii TaxID=1812935 RepID=UPI003872AB11